MPRFGAIHVVLAFCLQVGTKGSRPSEGEVLDLYLKEEVSQYCKKADGGTCLAKCEGCFNPCKELGLAASGDEDDTPCPTSFAQLRGKTDEVTQYCQKAGGGACLAKCEGCFTPCKELGLAASEDVDDTPCPTSFAQLHGKTEEVTQYCQKAGGGACFAKCEGCFNPCKELGLAASDDEDDTPCPTSFAQLHGKREEVTQYCQKAGGGTCLAKCEGCFNPCKELGLAASDDEDDTPCPTSFAQLHGKREEVTQYCQKAGGGTCLAKCEGCFNPCKELGLAASDDEDDTPCPTSLAEVPSRRP